MKKVISMVLVLVLLIGLLPMSVIAASTAETKFKGKTVSILGDSISTFKDISNNTSYNSTIGNNIVWYHGVEWRQNILTSDQTWWSQAISQMGMKLLVNNSSAGSRVFEDYKNWNGTLTTPGAYIDRCVQLHNKSNVSPDVIWVYLGTNDFDRAFDSERTIGGTASEYLGTASGINYDTLITDNGYAEPATVCEAYAIMLHKMKNRYPNAQIYCFTLLPQYGLSAERAEMRKNFSASIGKLAAKFSVGVVDLYNDSGIPSDETSEQYIPGATATGDAKNTLHPGPLGMDKMTECVVTAMVSPKTGWEGKKVSILGDSISTFKDVSNNASYNSTIGNNILWYNGTADRQGIDKVSETWWHQAISDLGMTLLVNNSSSASRVFTDYTSTWGNPPPPTTTAAYKNRCVNLHNDHTNVDPDVIWVYMGTNDFGEALGQSSPSNYLGLDSDEVDYDKLITKNGDDYTYNEPTTVCEAYAIMLHKMKNRYPDAEIYCFTLLPRYGLNSEQTLLATGFNQSIEKIAMKIGVRVVDLYNDSGIKSDSSCEQYIPGATTGSNLLHPGELGMDKMTDCVKRAMTHDCEVNYDAGKVTTKPSCEDAGIKTYTCTICSNTYTEPVASTGHSYEKVVTSPTCTADGYTTYTCNCGDSYIEDMVSSTGHNDAGNDGRCDACGWVLQPAKLVKYSLSLRGNIAINFYMLLRDDVVKDPNAYMLFTQVNGSTMTVPVSESVYKKDEGYYVFACEVAAKEMTDLVTCQFFYNGGETEKKAYSVKSYADYILKVSNNENLKNLVTAMLHYGAASQMEFNYKTDVLANAGMEEYDFSNVTIGRVNVNPSKGTELATFTAASLILKSETTLRFFFKLNTDVDSFTVTYSGNELEVYQRSGLYYVDVTDISANDLDENVTITIDDGTSTAEVTYNPLDYCATVSNGNYDREHKDLVAALYLYNQTANAYFQ